MLPLFRSKSVGMRDETQDQRRNFLWALPASLIVHGLIVALLFYGLSTPAFRPQEEQVVNVELVPPPDQSKPKPPPPPPTPIEEKPKPKVEEPPAPAKQPPRRLPIEVLKPVFQFGEKDSGPRKSPDGRSAQDSSPSPAKDDAKPSVTTKDEASRPASSPAAEPPDSAKAADTQATAAKDADTTRNMKDVEANRQEASAHDTDKPAGTMPAPLEAAGGDGEIALPVSVGIPQPRPANAPKRSYAKASRSESRNARASQSAEVSVARSQSYSGLPGVRKLYSQGATGDALATTSMSGLPRDKRIARLCASALQQQLLDASYFPELVPLIPLRSGNVVNVADAAFRTRTTWYRLSFRCEVDSGATRVLSITFGVGTVIPSAEWASLGLPIP
ncbi:DUF930 domain-containing protein [Mesorhizobium yinganensis]|uniref:DUF930 domain-containing protein n=1 Tax=Mesorhizobium yinganensis TaxID=3157707 RepID=UPI0032B7221F